MQNSLKNIILIKTMKQHMKNYVFHKHSKIIISLLEGWASYEYVNSKLGNTIMLPLVSPSEENIPYYKLQTVKLSVFISFIY